MTVTRIRQTAPEALDFARTAQINAWVRKHEIILRVMTEREAERVAKLYHAAMALDYAEAVMEDIRREYA